MVETQNTADILGKLNDNRRNPHLTVEELTKHLSLLELISNARSTSQQMKNGCWTEIDTFYETYIILQNTEINKSKELLLSS